MSKVIPFPDQKKERQDLLAPFTIDDFLKDYCDALRLGADVSKVVTKAILEKEED